MNHSDVDGDQQGERISNRLLAAIETATVRHDDHDADWIAGLPVRDTLFGILCRTCNTETHVVMQVLEFDVDKPGTARRVKVVEE